MFHRQARELQDLEVGLLPDLGEDLAAWPTEEEMTHTQLEHAPLPEDSLQDVTDVQGLRRREEDQGHPTVVDHEVRSTISEDGIILRTLDAHHHLQSGKDWRLQTVQDMIDLVHRLEEDILLPATSQTTTDQDLEHHHDVMI